VEAELLRCFQKDTPQLAQLQMEAHRQEPHREEMEETEWFIDLIGSKVNYPPAPLKRVRFMVQHPNLYILYVDGSPCFCLMSELVPNTLSVLFGSILGFCTKIVLIFNFFHSLPPFIQPLKGTGFSGDEHIMLLS
jgi:hypothetical protein